MGNPPSPKKIGIMGGTFNPIHNGHLLLGERAYEQFGLDEVWFMPSKKQPHKENDLSITDDERIRLVEKAIEGNPHFVLSTMEFEREGFTYTADTLSLLHKELPQTSFYFIIGGDSLYTIEKWYLPEVIFEHANIIATGRDGIDEPLVLQKITELKERFQANIHYLKVPRIDISSNDIRQLLRNTSSVRYMVPDNVYQYILEKELYR